MFLQFSEAEKSCNEETKHVFKNVNVRKVGLNVSKFYLYLSNKVGESGKKYLITLKTLSKFYSSTLESHFTSSDF